jgi:protocatechuate 3,4-dioxygenase, beta subunit
MDCPQRSLSRREILEMAIALGGLAITHPVGSGLAQEVKRQLTPEQVMGPFYPVLKPLDEDADLTTIRGKRGHAQGKVIHLMGRVLNSKGEPVRGARLEIWQANTQGRYAHPADINPAPLDPYFQGYGVQLTDAEGLYRFKTIKPGAYPINPINPGNMRPPHIHFDITAKKDRLVTQMYFPNEPLNEKDSIFKGLGSDKDAAIGKVLPPTKEVEPDSLLVVWDIVLDKG